MRALRYEIEKTDDVTGVVNGNGTSRAWDNNSDKDYYVRVARKWWGYPLDGQVADVGAEEGGVEVEPQVEIGMYPGPRANRLPSTITVRGQDLMNDVDTSSPGLDFWRESSFETGISAILAAAWPPLPRRKSSRWLPRMRVARR